MKLRTIYSSQETLKHLANEAELPAQACFRFAGILRKVETVLGDYDKAHRGLFDKYGEPTEDDPNKLHIPESNFAAFSEEHNALLDTEVEEDFGSLTIDDFDGVKLTAANMLAIQWLFDTE